MERGGVPVGSVTALVVAGGWWLVVPGWGSIRQTSGWKGRVRGCVSKRANCGGDGFCASTAG